MLVRTVGERLERRHVLGGAGRADERGPEALGLRDDELHRHALHGHAHRAALLLLDQGDDLRQRGEPLEEWPGLLGGARHREPLARVAEAADVSGRHCGERGRDALEELARAVQEQPAARAGLVLAGERLEQPRLRFGPTPGTERSRPAAAASRSSSPVRMPSAWAISTERLAVSPR